MKGRDKGRIHNTRGRSSCVIQFLPNTRGRSFCVLLAVLVLALSACGQDLPAAAPGETAAGPVAAADQEAADPGDVREDTAADEEGMTEPFQAFLGIMSQREGIVRAETGIDGYVYSLDRGSLSVSDADGAMLWRSDDAWWVDDFRLGDVDGDGVQDFVFSLWKSFRFGEAHPARMDNDDEKVRNHLFVYTVLSGHVKSIWGSSDLPYPIYSFELDPSGRVTPVSSGMLLKTREGKYTDDFSQTDAIERLYSWEGWGFVPIE